MTKDKITARDIVYSDEAIAAIGEKLSELIETLPDIKKKVRPQRNTARAVVTKFWPVIKKLLDKGYTNRYVCNYLKEQNLMDIQPGTFVNIINSIKKAESKSESKPEESTSDSNVLIEN